MITRFQVENSYYRLHVRHLVEKVSISDDVIAILKVRRRALDVAEQQQSWAC